MIPLIIRIAFGFQSAEALIVLSISASAATAPSCRAANDPQISQESHKSGGDQQVA